MTLSQLLREYFERTELSYCRVAQLCWVDVAYLHRLIGGHRSNPSRDIVLRMALGMRLTVAETDELLMVAGHAPILQLDLRNRDAVQSVRHQTLLDSGSV